MASGQNTDPVLVAGMQPLRQSDVDRLIEFYEWAFEVKFADGQREQMRARSRPNFARTPHSPEQASTTCSPRSPK